MIETGVVQRWIFFSSKPINGILKSEIHFLIENGVVISFGSFEAIN